jgi:hypothetical protein
MMLDINRSYTSYFEKYSIFYNYYLLITIIIPLDNQLYRSVAMLVALYLCFMCFYHLAIYVIFGLNIYVHNL